MTFANHAVGGAVALGAPVYALTGDCLTTGILGGMGAILGALPDVLDWWVADAGVMPRWQLYGECHKGRLWGWMRKRWWAILPLPFLLHLLVDELAHPVKGWHPKFGWGPLYPCCQPVAQTIWWVVYEALTWAAYAGVVYLAWRIG